MVGRACLILFCLLWHLRVEAETAYAQLSSFATQMPEPGGFSLAKMEAVDLIKEIDVSEKKDAIVIRKNGLYLLSFSGQLGSMVKGTEGYMDVWFVKNGKPIVNSNNRMYLSRLIPVTLLTTTALSELSPGDTLSIAYSASGPEIGLLYLPADKGPPIVSTIFSAFMVNGD